MDNKLDLDYKEGFNLGYALQKAGNRSQVDELLSITGSLSSLRLNNLSEGLEAGQRQAVNELNNHLVQRGIEDEKEKILVKSAKDKIESTGSETSNVILEDEYSERFASREIAPENFEKGEGKANSGGEKHEREMEEGVKTKNSLRDDDRRG